MDDTKKETLNADNTQIPATENGTDLSPDDLDQISGGGQVPQMTIRRRGDDGFARVPHDPNNPPTL